MFIRRMGRRLLVLESYRDGQGKVCQRRWGDFVDLAGLTRVCEALGQHLSGEQLSQLRERGESMLGELPAAVSVEERRRKVTGLAKRLVHALDEGLVPEGAELTALRQRLEKGAVSRWGSRRRRLEEHEAPDYVDALEKQIREQGPSLAVLEERVRLGHNWVRQLELGGLLQASGQLERARAVYVRISKRVPARHYQLASLAWAENEYRMALEHLCQGFLEDLDFESTRQAKGAYWENFGEHWSELGRAFFLEVAGSTLVRMNLARVRAQGVRVRRLLPSVSDRWFLPKVLKKLNLEEAGLSC
jgi:hypothetical protein